MEIGEESLEIPLIGTGSSIRERLVGSQTELEALSPNDSRGPGELGRTTPTLIYLSNLGLVKPDQIQMLHSAAAGREYLDCRGRRWKLSDDLWIVASLAEDDTGVPAAINLHHPLCSAFAVRYAVEIPLDMSELWQIANNIVDNSAVRPKPSIHQDLGAVLVGLIHPTGNLHSLRAWVEWAARNARARGAISEDDLQAAISADLENCLGAVRYCGTMATRQSIQRWLRRFPNHLQSVAYHLVAQIAHKYFINDAKYFAAIGQLIERSGIPRRAPVVFCQWQSQGKSGPAVAAKLKTRANWMVREDMDLSDERSWEHYDRSVAHRFIITDDCVGSGLQLSQLFRGQAAPVPRLLDAFPHSEVSVLLLLGYEHALRKVDALIRGSCGMRRVKLEIATLLTNHDRCFHDESQILRDPAARVDLRQFCIDTARDVLKLSPRFHLGFGEVGGLVVFYETVPNNTIPLLWARGGGWEPLFPVEGIAADLNQ